MITDRTGGDNDCSWVDAWDERALRSWRRKLFCLRLSWNLMSTTMRLIRRLLDIIAACLLLTVFLPQWLGLYVFSLCSGRSLHLHPQLRVGGGWTCFKQYTIVSDDPVLNDWLKTSKYAYTVEVFAVLRGHISMVGPIAPCIAELKEIQRLQMRRSSYRPGVQFLPFKQTNFFQSKGQRRLDVEWLGLRSYAQVPLILVRLVPLALSGKVEL